MGWAQLCGHVMTALLMRPLLMTVSYQLHKGVGCSKYARDAEETCPGILPSQDIFIMQVALVVLLRSSEASVHLLFAICCLYIMSAEPTSSHTPSVLQACRALTVNNDAIESQAGTPGFGQLRKNDPPRPEVM